MKHDPIVIGGNGHSGTRVFADILMGCGINMGVPGYAHDRDSKDLNIRRLMNRWMKSYLLGLDEADARRMQREFGIWIRLLIPLRGAPWGFKNPRSMFLLRFYHEMFPGMKFVHVIRDGRDMCFGNPFVETPTYWSYVSEEESASLTPERRMMRFWGESNRRVKQFGEEVLGDRYLRIRFEDMCHHPIAETERLVAFSGQSGVDVAAMAGLVRTPKSIGRWRSFDEEKVAPVLTEGAEYLREFGYT